MRNKLQFIVGLLLLVGVVVVFVAPAVNLEPTAMRAARAAQLAALALLAAATTALVLAVPTTQSQAFLGFPPMVRVSSADVVDLDCARLC